MDKDRAFTCFTCKKPFDFPGGADQVRKDVAEILGDAAAAYLDDDAVRRIPSCDACLKPFRDAGKAVAEHIDQKLFEKYKKELTNER